MQKNLNSLNFQEDENMSRCGVGSALQNLQNGVRSAARGGARSGAWGGAQRGAQPAHSVHRPSQATSTLLRLNIYIYIFFLELI